MPVGLTHGLVRADRGAHRAGLAVAHLAALFHGHADAAALLLRLADAAALLLGLADAHGLAAVRV